MEIKINTKLENGDKVGCTVNFDMPETLPELTKKFGEAQVAEAAISSFVIAIQNTGRRCLVPTVDKQGKVLREAMTASEIQAVIDDWMPDERGPVTRMSKLDRAKKSAETMTSEERKALLERIQELERSRQAA